MLIIPYVLVLIGGIVGLNVFVVLLIGIAAGAFGIIPLLFYPFLLCLSSPLFILFDKK